MANYTSILNLYQIHRISVSILRNNILITKKRWWFHGIDNDNHVILHVNDVVRLGIPLHENRIKASHLWFDVILSIFKSIHNIFSFQCLPQSISFRVNLELFGGSPLVRCDSVRFEQFHRICHLRKILFSNRSMELFLSLSKKKEEMWGAKVTGGGVFPHGVSRLVSNLILVHTFTRSFSIELGSELELSQSWVFSSSFSARNICFFPRPSIVCFTYNTSKHTHSRRFSIIVHTPCVKQMIGTLYTQWDAGVSVDP